MQRVQRPTRHTTRARGVRELYTSKSANRHSAARREEARGFRARILTPSKCASLHTAMHHESPTRQFLAADLQPHTSP